MTSQRFRLGIDIGADIQATTGLHRDIMHFPVFLREDVMSEVRVTREFPRSCLDGCAENPAFARKMGADGGAWN